MATYQITDAGNALLLALPVHGSAWYLTFPSEQLAEVPTLVAAKLVAYNERGMIRLTPAGRCWTMAKRTRQED